MTQMTLDGFMDENAPANAEPAKAETPRPETWYKGRVLSHSSISMYRTCPQRWKFRYIDKVPEKPRSQFSFGKSVHTALEFSEKSLAAERFALFESALVLPFAGDGEHTVVQRNFDVLFLQARQFEADEVTVFVRMHVERWRPSDFGACFCVVEEPTEFVA